MTDALEAMMTYFNTHVRNGATGNVDDLVAKLDAAVKYLRLS